MTPSPSPKTLKEWIYQLECIAPKVYAKQHMAVVDVLAYLSALAGSSPAPSAVDKRSTGLYNKFNVARTDGKSEPGQKHDGCEYFVLDVTHDKHAHAALKAYADSCEGEYPELAKDLRIKAQVMTIGPSPLAASETVPMSARQKELIAWGLRGGKDLVAPTQTQEKKADTESDQADCGIPDDDPASPAPEPETTKADLQQ